MQQKLVSFKYNDNKSEVGLYLGNELILSMDKEYRTTLMTTKYLGKGEQLLEELVKYTPNTL